MNGAAASVFRRTEILMDTAVTVTIVEDDPVGHLKNRTERAFSWFRSVEASCSRFDDQSEVIRLVRRSGEAVEVSPMLFEAVRFAIHVAEQTGGAFDPTVGRTLEARGFDRNYRTGRRVTSPNGTTGPRSYRDVELDAGRRTIRLRRPLVLDLGAVAKGMAIDLAAQELSMYPNFAIDAGGDLLVSGNNDAGRPWRVGIRHPRCPDEMVAVASLSRGAICTSGDYERRSVTDQDEHHIVDPVSGRSPHTVASATVVAPSAMVADALCTAVFVLGASRGMRLLEESGVEGMVVDSALVWHETRGFSKVLSP